MAPILVRGVFLGATPRGKNRERCNHRRHDRPKPCLVPNSDRRVRATDNVGVSPAPRRRAPVVLRVLRHRLPCKRALEASWSQQVRQSAGWGRQVAYRSQFQNASDRGYSGKERIEARLIGDLDPADWELPPKPKWMRRAAYNRYVERFDEYEERLDNASIASVSRRLGLKSV